MGNMYTVHVTKGISRDRVVAALSGRSAGVFDAGPGWVVVCDERADSQSGEEVRRVSELLSAAGGPCVCVMNHDDDVLVLQLAIDGAVVDEYVSAPDFFDGPARAPTGGDAARLCTVVGAGGASTADKLELVLRTWTDWEAAADAADGEEGSESPDYLFEIERHRDIVQLLGLPGASVGVGYRYLSAGSVTRGLDLQKVVWLKAS